MSDQLSAAVLLAANTRPHQQIQLALKDPEPSPAPGIDTRELDALLREAYDKQLVDRVDRFEVDGSYCTWMGLNATANGLRLLKHWPPPGQEHRPGHWDAHEWGQTDRPQLRELADNPPAHDYLFRPLGGQVEDEAWWRVIRRLHAAGLVGGNIDLEGIDGFMITSDGRRALDGEIASGPAGQLFRPGAASGQPRYNRGEADARRAASGDSSPAGDPPRLQPARGGDTGAFNLHMPNGPLNAHLENDGGASALVEKAILTTPLGSFEAAMMEQDGAGRDTAPTASARVAVDGHLTLQFGDGELAGLDQNGGELKLSVVYRRPDGQQRFEYRLQLLRAGGSVTDRPQWRAGEESMRQLANE